MKLNKVSVLILSVIVVLGGLGVSLYIWPSQQNSTILTGNTSNIKLTPPPTVASADKAGVVGADIWGKGSAAHAVETMRVGYLQDPDRRAFFEQALRHPEKGGLFYARKSFLDCMAIKGARRLASSQTTDVLRPPSPADLAIVQQAVSRCGSLGDSDSRQRLKGSLSTSAVSLDPALREIQRVQDAHFQGKESFNIASAALDQAIALGDPYVLMQALIDTIQSARTFDGKVIDKALNEQLGQATIVTHCDLGADCGLDPVVLLTCVQFGRCTKSVMDIVLSPDLEPSQRKAIAELAEKMTTAAREGTLPRLFQGFTPKKVG